MKRATAKIVVPLGKRRYPIVIGDGAVQKLPNQLKQGLSRSSTPHGVLVFDEKLHGHAAKVSRVLRQGGWKVLELPVTGGEGFKDFASLLPLYESMRQAGVDRQGVLLALGGGSIGDAAGFIASTYLRGIPWVGLPTTLLGQVDSSVGGKTAVNLPAGKNLIGTFHQPVLVICELDFLRTLSRREVISGLGEAVKYGLTYDSKFFDFIAENWERALHLDAKVMTEIIKRSLAWKARAVGRDEFDRSGVREVLNFGHTFAHALETATKYEVFQHGEAVVWGMRFAVQLSVTKGHLTAKTAHKVESLLSRIDVPSLPATIPFERYLEIMASDKKKRDGKVRFVLLKRIGATVLDSSVQSKELASAFKRMLKPGES